MFEHTFISFHFTRKLLTTSSGASSHGISCSSRSIFAFDDMSLIVSRGRGYCRWRVCCRCAFSFRIRRHGCAIVCDW